MNLKITKQTVWIVGGALAFGVVIHEDRNEHIELREYQERPRMSFESSYSTASVSTYNVFLPEMLERIPPKK